LEFEFEFALLPITPVVYNAVISPVTATIIAPMPVNIPGKDDQKGGFDVGSSAIFFYCVWVSNTYITSLLIAISRTWKTMVDNSEDLWHPVAVFPSKQRNSKE
jgi:hypothetical protein